MKIIGHLLSQLLLQLMSLFLNQLRRREVFYFSVPKICKRQRNLRKKKVLKLKMLRIYLLLKEIHGLNLPPIEETYDLNPLFIEEPPDLDNPKQVVKVNS